ncbi:acyl-CoA ligase (AMP-forming), exosortase A system-associated [Microbacterium aerolatum]|uniref:Acyl-CoA ligase (AMP-forming), exosortase A system-associated n=1 Tax=Microbacterium aerolatum TaxID=153731 RepID=A0A511ADQ3_9MICO|nr:acyl-CoA ligase (AMP-forming), exosortase A system-associated [Microbacterium aerolatum]GEK86259.1 acyl-CoA ligase (AMP-forming), exosortase A system-associated [Microbacterium aerolatum]GGB16527.1 acyl-CoA ligase (AMP-forming), exosortase A system-associated [Microbacterium aerolatum]
MTIRMHIHDLLGQNAALRADAPALTYGDATVGYGQLWNEVRTVAERLSALGLSRGDRVAIYLEKRVESVTSMFAASLAGGVFVPINHVLKSLQVDHILRDSGARVLVTSADRLDRLTDALAGSAVVDVIVIGAEDSGMIGDGIFVHPWPTMTPTTQLDPSAPPTIDIDPAAILYTSGSTGRPKGVVLSQRNLIVGAESVSSYLGNTPDDVILSVLPLSFDAGLSQVTTAFAVGAHCVLMNYLLPQDVPKLCARHGVTGITGVPPLWMQIADATWPVEVANHLRYWANTGGRMPRTVLARLREVFTSAEPFLMYGLTEAFRSTYLDPAEIDRRPDSIGKAIPNAEILVLRPDGTRCASGEEGELVHRGALVALGYWNDPERTAERYRPLSHPDQPWRAPEMAVWSGDMVRADEDGFLYFVGRTDDMIKTSGYRVSPTEIEEAAYGTGMVRDAVALGIEEPGIGHRIVLVVSGKDGGLDVAALRTALRRTLPLYMVPAQIQTRDELPRSPNGKFDRNLMKAQVNA